MRTIRLAIMAMLALVLSVGALSGVAAAGDQYPPDPPPTVLDDSVVGSGGGSAPKVLNSSASLPVTGGDVVGLTILGLGLVGVGVAFTTYRRRAEA